MEGLSHSSRQTIRLSFHTSLVVVGSESANGIASDREADLVESVLIDTMLYASMCVAPQGAQ